MAAAPTGAAASVAVRVQRRFRARLDLDRRPHIIRSWRRRRIPDQQGLPVGIGVVGLHPRRVRGKAGGPEPVSQDLRQLGAQWAVDIGLAGVFYGVEARLPFFCR